jgi:putative copper resistance protein D
MGVAIRLGLYLDLTLAFGLAAFGMLSMRGAEHLLPLRASLIIASLVGGVLSVLGLFALAASMAGTSIGGVDRETLGLVLSDTAAGTAWKIRIAALAIAAAAALWMVRNPRAALAASSVSFGISLATIAWTGHGAMDEGAIGWLHLSADIVHLLAAGAWIGALIGLGLLVTRRAQDVDAAHLALTHAALHGFSVTGTIVVALIIVSGLVNSWLLVGPSGIGALPFTLYGQLLLAKLALFGAMLVLAGVNRFRLTPGLAASIDAGDHRGAIGALRRSLALETSCAVVILALVAWLGTLEPIASAM